LTANGAGDWKYFINGLVGPSKPYILKGFDVIDPQNAIGTQSCSIRVADSIVMYPGSNAGPFYHGLSEGIQTLFLSFLSFARTLSTTFT